MSACVVQKHKKFGIFPIGIPRYITLEYSLNDNNEPITVLCEWKKDWSHLNFGEGPISEIDAFIRSINNLFLNRSPLDNGGIIVQ